MFGNLGSLIDPETGKVTLDQPRETWEKYIITGPLEHLDWLRGVLGSRAIDAYYYLRDYARSGGFLSPICRIYTKTVEDMMVKMMSSEPTLTMPHACRTAVYFFKRDLEIAWTFLSPPWYYRPGPKTETYGTIKEHQPVDGTGKYLGIYTGDLAVAVADEAETKAKRWTHWSCFGKQQDSAR